MNRELFFSRVLEVVSEEDLLLVHHAYWLAKRAHQDQKRDTGERYFEHCRRVVLILLGANVVATKAFIAALLHDCLEDGFIHPKIIEKIFGEEIGNAIQILSKTMPVFKKNGFLKERVAKDPAQYYKGITQAPEWIRKIKLADRIDNLSGMENWGEERKRRYLEETEAHYLPLAHTTDPRLAEKLEELCQKLRTSLTLNLDAKL